MVEIDIHQEPLIADNESFKSFEKSASEHVPTHEMGDLLMEDTKTQLKDEAEEGEITEDDEEQPSSLLHQDSNPNLPSRASRNSKDRDHAYRTSAHKKSSSKTSSKGTNKYKDYDGKFARIPNNQDNAMFNSWNSTIHSQRRGERRGDSPVKEIPTDDSERSITSNTKNQDNLPKPECMKAEVEQDKDFRTEDNRSGEIDDIDTEEDSDLRRVDSSFDRRRRHSISPSSQDHSFKRHRGGDDSTPPLTINNEEVAVEETYRSNVAGFGSPIGRGGFFRGRGGGFRFARGNFRPWTEHVICKFFREGYCRDGDNCTYSHNAIDSQKRTEMCRFYQYGFCKKGLYCNNLHGEFPCKAFHKGECTKEQCQFSHQPLDDFTRPLFEKMLKEEEMISSFPITGPGVLNCRGNFPLPRKAFLPHLADPQQSDSSQQIDPATGQIPPPSLVLPPMLSTPFNRGMAHIRETYGFFNPITPQSSSVSSNTSHLPINHLPIPQVVSTQSQSQPQQQQQQIPHIQTQPQIQPTGAAIIDEPPKQPQLAPTGPSTNITTKNEASSTPPSSAPPLFNISQMLEQITQQVTGIPSTNFTDQKALIDDSPASPPMFSEPVHQNTAKVIPIVCPWRLILVDLPDDVDMNFDLKLIQTISHSLNADPRLRKIAEKQFDQVTKSLTQEQNVAQAQRQAQNQPNAHSSITNSSIPPSTSSNPVDPRRKDPRIRSTKESSDFTQTKNTVQDASFESSEQLHQQDHSSIFGMLNPNNPDGDIDHRTFPLPPLNQPPPGYFAPYPQESQLGPVNIEEQQSTTEMPYKNSFGGFQNSNEHSEYNSGYRENSSFGHARNKEFGCRRGRFRGDRSRGTGRFGDGGSDAGPFQGQENNTENTGRYRGGRRRPPYLQNPLGNSSSARTDQQKDSIPQKTDIVPEPISTPQLSLREKRKNNEYESPLNRLARH